MKRIFGAFLLAVFVFAPILLAQHQGYWRQFPAQRDKNQACALTENQKDLEDVLTSLNWNMNYKPVVDWQNDSAIIIAPGYHHQGRQIAFYRIRWDGDDNRYYLEWGWEDPNQTSQGGGNSHTEGSTAPSEFGLIVVSFRRSMHTSNAFQCRELTEDDDTDE
jgi:hypothetical protein